MKWCAFTNFPWGRGLINFEPHEEAQAMETYHTWLRLFELQRYYSWIVDRFHISTRMYQLRAWGKDYDFRWIEERLAALGFHLVFCIRAPESILPKLKLDVSDGDVPRAVERIADWMTETGGLWAS